MAKPKKKVIEIDTNPLIGVTINGKAYTAVRPAIMVAAVKLAELWKVVDEIDGATGDIFDLVSDLAEEINK